MTKKFTSRAGLLVCTALVSSCLMAGTAWAQAAEEETGLDEIVVTAQKREQNLQDVPVAVSTLSDEKLDVLGSGGDDIRFLSARLPSLLIESSFGRAFPRFYIRGLGNTDFDLNASQPVSLVYDDVVLVWKKAQEKKWDGFEVVALPEWTPVPWGLAVKIEELNQPWGKFMSATLKDWLKSGTLVALEKKWVGSNTKWLLEATEKAK